MSGEDPGTPNTEFLDLTDSSSLDQDNFRPPVENWSRYQIESLLGEGGMAKVYKAFDPQLKRHIALKFIRSDDEKLKKRLLREAQSQAQIDHENVCKIYETGEVEGRPYISMQYIQGKTLNEQDFTSEQIVRLLQQSADAVHAAHRIGIIHRDLKPSNIMVERKEDGSLRPFVLDFGIARQVASIDATSDQTVLGTPSYMAPEQLSGDASLIDRRTDIYSLGATLYHLLTKRRMYEGTTVDVLAKLLSEEPKAPRKINPGIPQDLETIILKCIEKEPNRRYDSSRELAEDLKRYLDGDPILSHRPSFSYRFIKKARKHKAIVAVLGVSMLIVLATATLGINSWWQTSKRIKLAQEFSRSVEAMDWMMRVAHMSPMHDVRKEKLEIRKRIQLLEDRMKDAGKLGIGPGNYAIGKGYITLQDFDKAKQHLEIAWKNGYQNPESAYALGLTLGTMYQQELSKTEQIQSKELREERKKQIEKIYRNSSLQYLKSSKDVETQAPEYIEALILFYDKNYSSALQKADQAFKKVPWFYEAKILEGNIYRVLGREKSDKGDFAAAEQEMAKAKSAFLSAAEIGESDGMAYQGICSVEEQLFYMGFYASAKNLEDLKNQAKTACNRALEVDPENADTYDVVSRLYNIWAEHQRLKGENSLESAEAAIRAAEKSVELAPGKVEGYIGVGGAYWTKAKFEGDTGRNAGASLQLALNKLKPAEKIDPKNLTLLNQIGLVYMDTAGFEELHGKDPTASLDLSATYFKKVIEIKPDVFSARINYGIICYSRGYYRMQHGQDPVSSLTEAVQILHEAQKMYPKNMYCYRFLLPTYVSLALFKTWQNQDSSVEFSNAIKTYEEGKRQDPEEIFLYRDLAAGYIDQAEMKLDKQESPLADLQQARELLSTALKYVQDDVTTNNNLGLMYLVEARWKLKNKQNPVNSLTAAKDAFQKMIVGNPDVASGYNGLAEYYYWLAEHQKNDNHAAEAFITQGLEQVQKAIRIDQADAYAYGNQVMLFSLRANLERDENTKTKAKQSAQESFQKLVSLNKYVANRYKSYLNANLQGY